MCDNMLYCSGCDSVSELIDINHNYCVLCKKNFCDDHIYLHANDNVCSDCGNHFCDEETENLFENSPHYCIECWHKS